MFDRSTLPPFHVVGYRRHSDSSNFDYCWRQLTPDEARAGLWEPLYALDENDSDPGSGVAR
jgi:hypothetical protein